MKHILLISALFLITVSCSVKTPHHFSSTKSTFPAYQEVGQVKVEACSAAYNTNSSQEIRYDHSFATAMSKAKELGGDAIMNFEIIQGNYFESPWYSRNCYTIFGTAVKFTGASSFSNFSDAVPYTGENPQ